MHPRRRLSLNTERLTELTSSDLAAVAGGENATYTGNPFCVLSIRQPCVTSFCTLLCK